MIDLWKKQKKNGKDVQVHRQKSNYGEHSKNKVTPSNSYDDTSAKKEENIPPRKQSRSIYNRSTLNDHITKKKSQQSRTVSKGGHGRREQITAQNSSGELGQDRILKSSSTSTVVCDKYKPSKESQEGLVLTKATDEIYAEKLQNPVILNVAGRCQKCENTCSCNQITESPGTCPSKSENIKISEKSITKGTIPDLIDDEVGAKILHIPVRLDRVRIRVNLFDRSKRKHDLEKETSAPTNQPKEANGNDSNVMHQSIDVKEIVVPKAESRKKKAISKRRARYHTKNGKSVVLKRYLKECKKGRNKKIIANGLKKKRNVRKHIDNRRKKRKRERRQTRLKRKFRKLFGECMSLSEEEDENNLLKFCKRRKKDSNDSCDSGVYQEDSPSPNEALIDTHDQRIEIKKSSSINDDNVISCNISSENDGRLNSSIDTDINALISDLVSENNTATDEQETRDNDSFACEDDDTSSNVILGHVEKEENSEITARESQCPTAENVISISKNTTSDDQEISNDKEASDVEENEKNTHCIATDSISCECFKQNEEKPSETDSLFEEMVTSVAGSEDRNSIHSDATVVIVNSIAEIESDENWSMYSDCTYPDSSDDQLTIDETPYSPETNVSEAETPPAVNYVENKIEAVMRNALDGKDLEKVFTAKVSEKIEELFKMDIEKADKTNTRDDNGSNEEPPKLDANENVLEKDANVIDSPIISESTKEPSVSGDNKDKTVVGDTVKRREGKRKSEQQSGPSTARLRVLTGAELCAKWGSTPTNNPVTTAPEKLLPQSTTTITKPTTSFTPLPDTASPNVGTTPSFLPAPPLVESAALNVPNTTNDTDELDKLLSRIAMTIKLIRKNVKEQKKHASSSDIVRLEEQYKWYIWSMRQDITSICTIVNNRDIQQIIHFIVYRLKSARMNIYGLTREELCTYLVSLDVLLNQLPVYKEILNTDSHNRNTNNVQPTINNTGGSASYVHVNLPLNSYMNLHNPINSNSNIVNPHQNVHQQTTGQQNQSIGFTAMQNNQPMGFTAVQQNQTGGFLVVPSSPAERAQQNVLPSLVMRPPMSASSSSSASVSSTTTHTRPTTYPKPAVTARNRRKVQQSHMQIPSNLHSTAPTNPKVHKTTKKSQGRVPQAVPFVGTYQLTNEVSQPNIAQNVWRGIVAQETQTTYLHKNGYHWTDQVLSTKDQMISSNSNFQQTITGPVQYLQHPSTQPMIPPPFMNGQQVITMPQNVQQSSTQWIQHNQLVGNLSQPSSIMQQLPNLTENIQRSVSHPVFLQDLYNRNPWQVIVSNDQQKAPQMSTTLTQNVPQLIPTTLNNGQSMSIIPSQTANISQGTTHLPAHSPNVNQPVTVGHNTSEGATTTQNPVMRTPIAPNVEHIPKEQMVHDKTPRTVTPKTQDPSEGGNSSKNSNYCIPQILFTNWSPFTQIQKMILLEQLDFCLGDKSILVHTPTELEPLIRVYRDILSQFHKAMRYEVLKMKRSAVMKNKVNAGSQGQSEEQEQKTQQGRPLSYSPKIEEKILHLSTGVAQAAPVVVKVLILESDASNALLKDKPIETPMETSTQGIEDTQNPLQAMHMQGTAESTSQLSKDIPAISSANNLDNSQPPTLANIAAANEEENAMKTKMMNVQSKEETEFKVEEVGGMEMEVQKSETCVLPSESMTNEDSSVRTIDGENDAHDAESGNDNEQLIIPSIANVRSISPETFEHMTLDEPEKRNDDNVLLHMSEENDICMRCKRVNSTVACANCFHAYYCSKRCQELHWKSEHYRYCKQSTDITNSIDNRSTSSRE